MGGGDEPELHLVFCESSLGHSRQTDKNKTVTGGNKAGGSSPMKGEVLKMGFGFPRVLIIKGKPKGKPKGDPCWGVV